MANGGHRSHTDLLEENKRLLAEVATLRSLIQMERQQAEAEVEALKCCGNCEHLFDDCGQGLCGWANPSPTRVGSPHVNFADPCFRAPSRWERREP